ncbi:Aste57867_13627 [Aphanomyces stellatus]|uniref:Aste57867_13627 protein n=1 Tax=Aphanomyces stellatus TaxID=120398 RepID=A0A485KZ53_9STRA|nr:hypothetical protein As57867_013577 [Aphanomyces stellatus]VFT90464.1 Aste57867_13627 [Aphanomyces stellatus]
MATSRRKLRFLCLHGGRSNSTIMTLQTSGFLQAFGASADLVELDGTYKASGPPEDEILSIFGEDEPYFEWWDSNDHEDEVYPGWEKSLERVQRHVEHKGPYDVILGFSQGAMMATLMTAHYLEKKWVPYKAVVLVGGMWPADGMPSSSDNQGDAGNVQLNFPAIHVLGEKDFMYEDGKKQIEHYTASSRHVFTHAGGHRFPALPQYKDMYSEIAKTLHTVCAQARDF